MLDALKCELKHLVGDNRHDELFRRLGTDLNNNAPSYNDALLLKSSFSDRKRAEELGLIDEKTNTLSSNKVNKALLGLIDRINKSDLSGRLQRIVDNHRHIPVFHAYTCDRVTQKDAFEIHFFDPPDSAQKVDVFYLYGDARQEIRSLFVRLGYEISGHLLNREKGDYDPGTKIRFFKCKPQASDNPRLFQINIMRELMAQFFEPVNSQQPILNKTVSDLCKSSLLKDFGPDDLVFILLTIDDYNWRERVTPAVVKDLIKNFCQCEALPTDAPHFFFFFGIEYSRDNTVVKEQVKKAVNEREYGEVLPELGPVDPADVHAWFKRYEEFGADGADPETLTRTHFGEFRQKDMTDIVLKLKEIIEKYNLGTITNPV